MTEATYRYHRIRCMRTKCSERLYFIKAETPKRVEQVQKAVSVCYAERSLVSSLSCNCLVANLFAWLKISILRVPSNLVVGDFKA